MLANKSIRVYLLKNKMPEISTKKSAKLYQLSASCNNRNFWPPITEISMKYSQYFPKFSSLSETKRL